MALQACLFFGRGSGTDHMIVNNAEFSCVESVPHPWIFSWIVLRKLSERSYLPVPAKESALRSRDI
jgi:hypothetical protein